MHHRKAVRPAKVVATQRLCRQLLLASISVAAGLTCTAAFAQGQPGATTAYASGRILAMPRAGLPAQALQAIVRQEGAQRARGLGRNGLVSVEVAAGSEQQLVERLRRHPHFEFAELDIRVGLQSSNDPFLGSQWHLPRIGANSAWATSTGSNVVIAILDTGVDGAHPDLRDRMVPGYNAFDGNTDTRDVQGHGTAVAGSAAATLNNGAGVASPAGAARIMPVRVSQLDGYAYFSTIASALTWAADNGARVANISYGVSGSSSVQSAANYMRSKGGLVVVSAGNNGRDEGIAASSTMITVSATDSSDNRTSWSSFGSMVDLAAPGAGIYTTVRGGSYGSWNGTSFSAPITAGVVAQMMAVNPSLAPAELESILFSTAVDRGTAGYDIYFGWGRVNAEAAVAAAAVAVSSVDTQPPTAMIASPAGGATATGLVTVDVSASDNKGVSRVDLLVNGTRVASDSSAPFAFSWDSTNTPNGNAELKAVAVDAAGNVGTSAGVWVNVSNVSTVVPDTTPPVVAISNPANGSTVSGTVRVAVSASDNSGSAGITNELFVGSQRVATSTGGALSYNWNVRKLRVGSYTLTAVSRDAAGNSSSTSVTVRR